MNFRNISPGLPLRSLGSSVARLLGLGSLALIVTACASVVYEGKYSWKDGWREAKVEKIGLASDLGDRSFFDCRHKMAPGQASGRFAILGLQHMGRHRHQIAPLDATWEPAKGDEVLTNVRRCESPVARSGK